MAIDLGRWGIELAQSLFVLFIAGRENGCGYKKGFQHFWAIKTYRTISLMLLLGGCCAGFLIFDVITPYLMPEPFSGMVAIGVVTAQLTVICVWGTLVRGTFWVRFPRTLLLLVFSWAGFSLGIDFIGDGGPPIRLSAGITWFIGFLITFVPLKAASLWSRWQIVQDNQKGNASCVSTYSIREIMLGIFLLSLSLGIGRAIIPFEGISQISSLQNDPEFLVIISIYGLVSSLVTIPCIWISLKVDMDKVIRWICIWIIYCLLLSVIEIGVVGLIAPLFIIRPAVLGLILGNQLMGAIILGICFALRGLGYKLRRPQRKSVLPRSGEQRNFMQD